MNAGSTTARNSKAVAADIASPEFMTVTVPAQIRGDDGRLRSLAINLLALSGVRSVIIHGDRQQAVVRRRASHASSPGVAEIPVSVFLEPRPVDNTTTTAIEDSTISWIDPRDSSWCFIALPPGARGLRRVLLMIAAALTLTLGLLGVVLPGLPTTPFVIVASYCLLRSSPRLHAWLLDTRLFGGVLRDWHLHRGLRPHIRYKAIAVIVLVLGASLLLTTMPFAAKLTIFAVAAAGITYVWRLPNIVEQVSKPAR